MRAIFSIACLFMLTWALAVPGGAPPSRPSDRDATTAAPPHHLRADFSGQGVRVQPRSYRGAAASIGLTLARLGRNPSMVEVPPGEVSEAKDRVEITRPDLGLVEWFVNTDVGLEHGFTLAEPPAPVSGEDGGGSSTAAEPLVLELAVEGADAALIGERVVFSSRPGGSLDYHHLAVFDARGATLPARFEVPSPKRLRLIVDDAQATYPIVIDPLLTSTADAVIERNLAGAGVFDVASAGDVNGDGYDDLVLGSAGGLGGLVESAAFVFHGGPTGVATGGIEQADTVLTAPTNTKFGQNVASAGDVNGDGFDDLIVGAHWTDTGQGTFEGAAYLFLGSPTGIPSGGLGAAAARLEGNQAGGEFGIDVASAGDVNGDGYDDVIVGARTYDNGQTDEGAAFVFLGSSAGIANGSPATAAAILESNQASAQLGTSVSPAGDVNGDGYADVIVGAPRYTNGESLEGAAFVFLGSALGVASGHPGSAATMLESNQTSGGVGNAPAFGASVACAGDVDGDGYDDVIVGAAAYDKGQIDEGAAFLFLGSGTGVADGNPATAATVLESDQGGNASASSAFGTSVASAGDVNGDGYADVIVGASRYDDAGPDRGAAFVALGSATGVASGVAFVTTSLLRSYQDNANFGLRVASAGDLDQDGFADVVVAAQNYDAGQSNEGAAFVYRGGGTVGERFEGVSLYDAIALPGVDSVRPDPSLAVGRTQLLQTTNGAYAVFDKQDGTLLQLLSPEQFWHDAGQSVWWPFSARVLYDADEQRWLAAALAQRSSSAPENEILLAVSDTDDALGTWKSVSITGAAVTPDLYFDELSFALDQNAVYVGTNELDLGAMFGGFSGTRLYVIPVDSVFSATGPSTANMRQIDRDFVPPSSETGFLPSGVHGRRSGDTGIVVAMSSLYGPNVAFQLTGLTPSSASGSTLGPIVYGASPSDTSFLPSARQPALAVPENRRVIDTGGVASIGSSYESQGRIYTVQTVAASDGQDETRLHWTVLDAETLESLAYGEIGTPGYDSYLGSLAVNAFGDVVVTYNRSGLDPTTGNISHMAQVFRTATDGSLLSVSGEMLLRTSPTDDYHNGSAYGMVAYGPQSWGVHSQVALDPDDPARFYVMAPFAREYNLPQFGHPNGNGASRWGTSIAVIRIAADCDNGVDDDGDGLIDHPADPGCFEAASQTESPACDDDLDNDNDGKVDWDGGAGLGTPDPQCSRPYRNKETPKGCGLGVEVAGVLLGLAAWRRRSPATVNGWFGSGSTPRTSGSSKTA